jgi:uncharacterized delta-60 repeat protein
MNLGTPFRVFVMACVSVSTFLCMCASASGQVIDRAFNPGADAPVSALALQADGKILVGGDFATLGGGGTGTTPRSKIGRLNADGSLDIAFNPGADGAISVFALQADGKILVGGLFSKLGGGGSGTTTRNRLGRLNADGSLDSSFNPGANYGVRTLVVQADGKILVGGDFTTLGGGGTGTTSRSHIGRLNADGSLDTSFDPGLGPAGTSSVVYTIAVQTDGKILVGGQFSRLGTTVPRSNIGRLNADGSVDTNFDPGADHAVSVVAAQRDGKILVGGAFMALGNGGTRTCHNLGRLNQDGSADAGFNSSDAPGDVLALTMYENDRPLVWAGLVSSDSASNVGFDARADDRIVALAVQSDGKIVVGGTFSTLSGGGSATTIRNHIGRLVPLAVPGGTPTPFTDPSLAAGVTPIRTVHIAELRTRVDALRVKDGLSAYAWTDATLVAGHAKIRAVHITELRAALQQAYVAAGVTPPVYTDQALAPGLTAVKAVHVLELRSAVVALESADR